MKHLPIVPIIAIAAIAACTTMQKRNAAENDQPVRYLLLPSEELAERSGTPLKQLHVGFGVWVRECGKCHEHVFPEDMSGKDWHVTTPKMAWNANISDAEQDALLKYILATKGPPSEFSKQLEGFGKQAR